MYICKCKIYIHIILDIFIYTLPPESAGSLEHRPLVCKGSNRRNEFPLILEEESVYIILYTIINICTAFVEIYIRSYFFPVAMNVM